jgi:NADH:ubiquinone reductase (H+-translocating)
MAPNRAENVVVLGGGYAGLMAALRLGRRAGSRARVTVVNGTDELVERIRLHQAAAGQVLPAVSISKLLARRAIAFRRGWARAIDLEQRRVDVDGERIGYDSLVIALGSRTDHHRVPGVEEHAHTLDADGPAHLNAALRALSDGARVLVIGGGLTAIETASELGESFPKLRVALISAGPIGAQLSKSAQHHVRLALTRLGVEVVEGCAVSGVERGSVSSSSGPIACELCVWTAGFRGHPLLARAGLDVNQRGQVWVDRELRPRGGEHARTWVVGDAASPEPAVGAPIYMTCKTAMPMGAHAADNIARSLRGVPQEPFSFGDTGYCVSLGRHDGVVQLVKRDGTLEERIITGGGAAFFKRQISAYTVWSLRLEARFGIGYRWFKGPASSLSSADQLEHAAQAERSG